MKLIKLFGKEVFILSREERNDLKNLIEKLSLEGRLACIVHKKDIKERDRHSEMDEILDQLCIWQADYRLGEIWRLSDRLDKILRGD